MKTCFLSIWQIMTVVTIFGFPQIILANNSELKEQQDCVKIVSDLDRLACFDKKYSTPSHLESAEAKKLRSESLVPEWIRNVYQWESLRTAESPSFLENISGPVGNETVRLSTPSQGNYAYQPILLVSCVDNITRLQVALKKPIDKNTFAVNISGSNSLSANYKWKISENGYVVDAGRGLYSIKIIASFFNQSYLNIDLTDAGIGKVYFDTNGLSKSIKTLRKTCHW